jgi:hypothetical protein
MLSSQVEILHRLEELEDRVGGHDDTLKTLVVAIRRLMLPPAGPRPPIGFTTPENTARVL